MLALICLGGGWLQEAKLARTLSTHVYRYMTTESCDWSTSRVASRGRPRRTWVRFYQLVWLELTSCKTVLFNI